MQLKYELFEVINIYHIIILFSLVGSLLLCSCSAEDASGNAPGTLASDNHSIVETEAVGGMPESDTVSIGNRISVSSKEDSSAYFPELLSSAAALDSDTALTDFDRMIKEVSTFDTKAFVKNHSYALDHFTGRMFEYGKLFIKYDRQFFDGQWLYGNYILRLIHYTVEPQDSGIYVESIFNIDNSYRVPRVPIGHFDKNGEYIPLEKEVTRADIDDELNHNNVYDLDSVSDIVRMHEQLFEDRDAYHDDSFIEEFKKNFS